jgi:hypothetical protein
MNPFKRRPKTKLCAACGEEISNLAFPCKHCGERFCVVCGHDIPPFAPYCKECKSYQSGVRRFFSLSNTTIAWVTAFFAVISTIVSAGSHILDRESETGFKVTGANDGSIHIRAWNSGRKPSTLLNYQLEIDKTSPEVLEDKLILTPNSQNENQPAQQVEKRIIILQGRSRQIDLAAVKALTTTACTSSDDKSCIQRIRDQLNRRTFTLSIQVQESGRWWKLWGPTPVDTKKDREVPGDVIEDFFIGACCEIR